MTRVQKNKEARKTRKMLLYPIITFVIMAIILIMVVDYRINNAIGAGGIRIVDANLKDDRVVLSVFAQKVANVDFAFVKRDILNLKEKTIEYVDRYQNMTRAVIKLY